MAITQNESVIIQGWNSMLGIQLKKNRLGVMNWKLTVQNIIKFVVMKSRYLFRWMRKLKIGNCYSYFYYVNIYKGIWEYQKSDLRFWKMCVLYSLYMLYQFWYLRCVCILVCSCTCAFANLVCLQACVCEHVLVSFTVSSVEKLLVKINIFMVYKQ